MPDLETPSSVRRLHSEGATKVITLIGAFEDLQAVLSCCERLVPLLADPREPAADPVSVEALWTLAVLSYARAFADADDSPALTEDDVVATRPDAQVLRWHKALLHLRDQYAHRSQNPRETFTVGLAQDDTGAVAAVAVTSVRAPAVDDAAVREAGAIAFALCEVLDRRIAEAQQAVLDEARTLAPERIAAMEQIPVAAT